VFIGWLSPQRPISRLRAGGFYPSGASKRADPCLPAGPARCCFPLCLQFTIILFLAGCGGFSGQSNGDTAPSIPSDSPTSPPLSTNFTSLNFGPVPVRRGSVAILTLENTSNAAIVVSGSLVSGEAFSLQDVASNMVLAPNQSVLMAVNFDPITEGPATDTLTFLSSGSNLPLVITVNGLGVRPRGHFVTLTWNPSTSPVSGYIIYRGILSGGPYTNLTDFPIQANSYTDVTVQPVQTYFYVVTALDSRGVQSVPSNEASVKIPSN
jgi:Abnormal spindle-like microcephaly-assoc'd, ASPM-SPD-2-Hydin